MAKKKDKKQPLPAGPIAAGVLGLLLLIGLAVWFWPGRQPPPAEEAVGRQVADQFLAELRAKRPAAAWKLTSAEFKSDEGEESFVGWAAQRPMLAEALEFQEYRVGDFNGLKRAECLYRPSAPASATPIRIIIGQELGEWKVEGVFVE